MHLLRTTRWIVLKDNLGMKREDMPPLFRFPSFHPAPLPLSASRAPGSPSRLGQCQNSGAVWRDGNPSWSEFPTPTRPCACHIPAQRAARTSMSACVCVCNERLCTWASVCVVRCASRTHARTPRRTDLYMPRMHRQLCLGRAFRCTYARVRARNCGKNYMRIYPSNFWIRINADVREERRLLFLKNGFWCLNPRSFFPQKNPSESFINCWSNICSAKDY